MSGRGPNKKAPIIGITELKLHTNIAEEKAHLYLHISQKQLQAMLEAGTLDGYYINRGGVISFPIHLLEEFQRVQAMKSIGTYRTAI